jgi:hypothetical protein
VRRFYGKGAGQADMSADPADFQIAWRHHWTCNPHHWEYWLPEPAQASQEGRVPLEMPERYAREMVADWMGAGRAITGRWDVQRWYAKHKDTRLLHPVTRALVEELLRSVRTPAQTPPEAP